MAKRVDIPVTTTLLRSLPCLYDWLSMVDQLKANFPKLCDEVNAAEREGAVNAARAFLALYLIKTKLDEQVKAFGSLWDDMKESRMPEVLELEGMTNVPLDEGYRVQTAETMYVAVKSGQRAGAMDWLRNAAAQSRDGGALADLIIETINASTLSAAGRYMLEEFAVDLPGEFFEVYFQPTTSVNKIASKSK